MQLTLFDDIYGQPNLENEMLEKLMHRGSGFVDGKQRIYEFVKSNPTVKSLAIYLRDEYGTGGSAQPAREPYCIHRESHDSKGIQFRWINGEGLEISQTITWTKAAQVLIGMIERGSYNVDR